jgi:hypothetical protein
MSGTGVFIGRPSSNSLFFLVVAVENHTDGVTEIGLIMVEEFRPNKDVLVVVVVVEILAVIFRRNNGPAGVVVDFVDPDDDTPTRRVI